MIQEGCRYWILVFPKVLAGEDATCICSEVLRQTCIKVGKVVSQTVKFNYRSFCFILHCFL